jgi:hypothetical protein
MTPSMSAEGATYTATGLGRWLALSLFEAGWGVDPQEKESGPVRGCGSDQRRITSGVASDIVTPEELALVQEDCQSNQGHCDDPQNDVFAALFFVCHREEYTILEIGLQVA